MIHSHDMDDTVTLLSDDSGIQTWICHLLAVQAEDVALNAKQPPLSRLSRHHDTDPPSQPISPTSDSVDMHAPVFGDLTRSGFLAFRPTHEDIPESVASTFISSANSSYQLSRNHSIATAASTAAQYDNHTLRYVFLGLDLENLDVDHSCLDGLDEQLLYHPVHSYVAACWAEATDPDAREEDEEDEEEEETVEAPISPPQSQPRFPLTLCTLVLDDDTSFLSHSDSTATPTIGLWAEVNDPERDDETISIDSLHHTRIRTAPQQYQYLAYATSPIYDRSRDERLGSPTYDGGYVPDPEPLTPPISPFVVKPRSATPPHGTLDGYFTGCDPKDTIHFYPVSPLARQRGQPDRERKHGLGRLTAFCATLPRRFIHPVSAA